VTRVFAPSTSDPSDWNQVLIYSNLMKLIDRYGQQEEGEGAVVHIPMNLAVPSACRTGISA
jgi:hypothetical protein